MKKAARPASLKWQLVGIAVWITLVAGLCGFGVTQVASLREAERIHDDGLQLVGQLLLGLSSHELEELPPDASLEARLAMGRGDTAPTLGNKYRYQIWSNRGQFLIGNHMGPTGKLSAHLGSVGLRWIDLEGERWRLFVMQDSQQGAEIQIAESQAAREWSGSVRTTFLLLVLPGLMLVLLPALWLLSQALRPLAELAGDLRERSPSDLHAVTLRSQLSELLPVQAALNRLFDRVSAAIRRESSFTALAAHEMRTPLATMRIVAESALSAGEGPQRDMALKELLAGMDLCSHLQDQLLTLARLDTSDARLLDQRFAMIEIVDEALLATAAEARAKAQKIQVSVDDAEMVGNRFAVLTLLRNLVANAMRYASREGTVRVTTCRSGLDIQMKVEDDGPGIPPELRERALERFERLNAASGSGAGLGLSIAKSVVTLHGAELQLGQSPLGGLLVEVHFPGRAVPPESDMDIEQHAPPRPRTDAPASESRHRSPQGH